MEDSILIDLSIVNLANRKIEESKEYYERYRVTYLGQMTFKDVDFDSARHIFMRDIGSSPTSPVSQNRTTSKRPAQK